MSTQAGTLFVVATPIGNLEDLAPRAARALRDADCIFCEDTRHSGRLLAEIGAKAPRVSLHEHNEHARLGAVLERLGRGENCALISDAGTPLISDPGYVLVRAVRAAGFRVVPLPGPSAVIAALCAAGLPTDRFAYEGFLPAKAGQRRERLAKLAAEPRTLVFYEAPHRLRALLNDAAAMFGGERQACVAREITKLHEEFRDGALRELVDWAERDPNATRGEIVVLIEGCGDARAQPQDTDTLLRALLEELPASKAARVAAKLTAGKRQDLYQRALDLSAE